MHELLGVISLIYEALLVTSLLMATRATRAQSVVAAREETSNNVRIYYAIKCQRPWAESRPGYPEVLPTLRRYSTYVPIVKECHLRWTISIHGSTSVERAGLTLRDGEIIKTIAWSIVITRKS